MEATTGQEDMIPRARQFLKWLDDEKHKVIIPANVIAEFLMLIPHEKHGQLIDKFNKQFIVAPFDTAAASCFAKIWRERKDDGTIDQLKNGGATKNRITFDCQIVAIAITRGASCIYSHDTDLSKFAYGYIEVKEIPSLSGQLGLLT